MHLKEMHKSLAQTRLIAAITASGRSDAEIATLLGVHQSTVSRLKNGLIAKVSKHQKRLDSAFGSKGAADVDEIADLLALAKVSPALRDALLALRKLMQENA